MPIISIKPRHLLSDDVIETVLAASPDVRIVDKTLVSLVVAMPSIDWWLFGLRLMKQPFENVKFEVSAAYPAIKENKYQVWVTFFNPDSLFSKDAAQFFMDARKKLNPRKVKPSPIEVMAGAL